MKKAMIIALAVALLQTAIASSAQARGSHYRHHHYRPHHYSHHYSHHYRSYHYDSDWAGIALATVGVGIVAGALFSAMASEPAPQRTVVYQQLPPQPVYLPPPQPVYQPPVVVYQQSPPVNYDGLPLVAVTADNAELRFNPDYSASVTGVMQRGEVVGVIGHAPDWVYVRLANGAKGWLRISDTSAG